MRRFDFALVLGFLASSVWGCSVYDEGLLRGGGNGNGGSGNGGDGGSSGGDGGGMTGGSGGAGGGDMLCSSVAIPLRDDSAPSSQDDSEEFGLVFSRIDFGDRPEGIPNESRSIGFNLDLECTTASVSDDAGIGRYESSSCSLPPYSNGQLDGPDGTDNAMGTIIQRVRDLVGGAFSSDSYTEDLRGGGTNFFVNISKWNGTPNDSRVTLSLYVAAPYNSFDPNREPPKWDGTDQWPIASDSLEGCDPDDTDTCDFDRPNFSDPNGYIVNNRFVGRLDESELRIDVGLSDIQRVRMKLELSQAIVACDIVTTDAGLPGAENCILAGRWDADHLLKQLSQFPDPLPPPGAGASPLCLDSSSYCTFKRSICGAIDIFVGVPAARPPCDGLSFGMNFDMAPALPMDVFIMEEPDDRCARVLSPNQDSCADLEAFPTGARCSPHYDPSGTGGAGGTGGTGGTGQDAGDSGPGDSGTGGTGPTDASTD